MYYKIDNKIYTEEEIAGKTFSEENKPEPVFTLREMLDLGYNAATEPETTPREYFKQQFNISI